MALQIWLPFNGDTRNRGLIGDDKLTWSSSYPVTFATSYNKMGSKCIKQGFLTCDSSVTPTLFSSHEYTIAAWINIEQKTTPNGVPLIGQWDGATTNNVGIFQANVQMDSATAWRMSFRARNNTDTAYGSDYVTDYILYNTWAHIAFVVNSTEVKVYVNGVLNNTTSFGTTITRNYYNFNFDLLTVDYNNGAKSLISDFRVYNNCLSATEIKDLSKGLILHYPMDQDINMFGDDEDNPYYQVDSISTISNAPQCMDLGITTSSSTTSLEYELDIKYDPVGVRRLMGVNSSASAYFGVDVNDNYSAFGMGATSQSLAIPVGNRDIVKWGWDFSNGTTHYTVNDVVIYAGTGATVESSWYGKVTLFGINNSDSWASRGITLYGAKIRVNGVVVRDLVPVVTNPRGVCGLYDRVGETFYACKNNGAAFSYGAPTDLYFYDCSGCENGCLVSSGHLSRECENSPRYESYSRFVDNAYLTIWNANKMVPAINGADASFTVTGWINVPNTTTVSGIFEATGTAYTSPNTFYIYQGNGVLRAGLSTSSADYYADATYTTTNTWRHFACVYNRNSSSSRYLYVYLDGVRAVTKTLTSTVYLNLSTSSTMFSSIGKAKTYYSNDCKLSDFRIYSTALSADMIKEMYNVGEKITRDGTLMCYSVKEV